MSTSTNHLTISSKKLITFTTRERVHVPFIGEIKMIAFMIITTILLFLADILNEYWNIDVTPDDITIIFGKDERNDI